MLHSVAALYLLHRSEEPADMGRTWLCVLVREASLLRLRASRETRMLARTVQSKPPLLGTVGSPITLVALPMRDESVSQHDDTERFASTDRVLTPS